MPNLKDIRTRIRSVKSTQKITQAMKMVAAAKVKRAENRVKASRPYSKALQAMFATVLPALQLAKANGELTPESSRYVSMLGVANDNTPARQVAVLVVGADRGLCGAYNASVLRQAFKLEKSLLDKGITPHFYLVGNKVIQAFKRYSQSPVLGSLGGMTAAPSAGNAAEVTEALVGAYLSGKVDRIEILSTQFISMISNQLALSAVFPVNPAEAIATPAPTTNLAPHLVLSPNPATIIDELLPAYLKNRVYLALLEASASELASRMTAMSNATKNAGEMINKLTVQYNKLRQAAITQEILEIVSGAQALT
jgi:F-type H+-transporting ATPase subunit gamma